MIYLIILLFFITFFFVFASIRIPEKDISNIFAFLAGMMFLGAVLSFDEVRRIEYKEKNVNQVIIKNTNLK